MIDTIHLTKKQLMIVVSTAAVVFVILVAMLSYTSRKLSLVQSENSFLQAELDDLRLKQQKQSKELEAKNLRLDEMGKMIQEIQKDSK
ncbi:MAG: hypothetical protein CMJ90_14970 [Planctomycetes bacterium]|nr:hypothetical protein [Planctomycetota bacterium]